MHASPEKMRQFFIFFLIKYLGKNSLEISIFIATTTKKIKSVRGVRGILHREQNCAFWCILKCILIQF